MKDYQTHGQGLNCDRTYTEHCSNCFKGITLTLYIPLDSHPVSYYHTDVNNRFPFEPLYYVQVQHPACASEKSPTTVSPSFFKPIPYKFLTQMQMQSITHKL